MGQRTTPHVAVSPEILSVSVFPTPLGYWAIAGIGDQLFGLTLGHADAGSAELALRERFAKSQIESNATTWHSELRHRLVQYSSGERVDFSDIKVHLPPQTVFQQQIIELTRKLPYGARVSYGELAARANHPRAARAVGTVMRTNLIPIIIPCHRVVGSGNSLGGYSAPQGLSLKTRLLDLERA